MKIGIGNDHVAVEYKEAIAAYIQEKYGYEVVNFGTDSTDALTIPSRVRPWRTRSWPGKSIAVS